MYKIGVDIVMISRIEKSIKSESFINKVYTEQERRYCKNAESFAGIFAAKEAYFKALGTGISMPMSNVEILHDEKGKPYINGIADCDVSISHDGDYAVSTVILW
ncbi:MAG: holo-ACP synthase [Eubacterium sp.]